jgi:hypothetical protein
MSGSYDSSGGPLLTHLCRLSDFTSIENLVTTIIHLTACRYVPKHLAIKLDVVSDKTHDGWRLEFLILENSQRGLALGPCTLRARTVALYFLFYVHACCAHNFIDIVQLYFPNYQMWGVANRLFRPNRHLSLMSAIR